MPNHEPVLTNFSKYVEYLDEDSGPRGLRMLFAVALHFAEGVLVVEADPDDDTVAMRLGPDVQLRHWPNAVATDLTHEPSWSERLGSVCLWRWVLTNQQGFQDGAQVELSKDGQDVVVQWIAMASSLRAMEAVTLP